MAEDVEKILFYRLSDRYIEFLRSHDPGVQQNAGEKLRPYVGILLELGGHKYYAPLSSYKPKYQKKTAAFFKVYEDPKKDPVSVIKFNCMIPVLESEMTYVDFSNYGHDPKYQALLEAEYQYIKSKRSEILDGARKLYDLANKPDTYFAKTSCNFKLLEEVYKSFKP